MESESKLYLQSLSARGLTKGSIKTNGATLHKLRRTVMKPLSEVTYADLVGWQAAQTVGNTTKHHRTQHVKAFFQWAQDTGLIVSNPARNLARPKRGKRLPDLLSEAELNRLLAWKPSYARDDRFLETRDWFLIRLFMYTGIRRAEACALTIGDVSLEERVLRVRHGKFDKDRAIPLPDRFIPDLAKYLKVRGGEAQDPLLAGRWTGRSLDPEAITYIFIRKLREVLARPLTPHLLRHSYATFLLRKEVDIRRIQELLGHSSLSTTQVYLSVSMDDLHRAVSAFDSL